MSEAHRVRNGLLSKRLRDTAIAIVDLETTGIDPRRDRVVEIAIRRFDAAKGDVTTYDTLLNPDRPMDATFIHGIRDDDVRDAPRFEDVAGKIVDLLSGAVFASYNVYFDARFMVEELSRTGVQESFPQLCLMLLKPMLGLGPRCSLNDACADLGVPIKTAHTAWADAEACEGLLSVYLDACKKQDIDTFQDLALLAEYQFLSTFSHLPLPSAEQMGVRGWSDPLSRGDWPLKRLAIADTAARRTYFDALTAVLADLVVTDEEFAYVRTLQRKLALTREQIRALHARAFLCIMMNFISDDWLDDQEVIRLTQASRSLAELGWTPGSMDAAT